MGGSCASREFQPGRCFTVRMPYGKDFITSLTQFCVDASIRMAWFSAIGAVSSATIGAYDQKQQVYITFKEERALEILSCAGNISLMDGKPFVHAHVTLSDEQGKTIGGHLFSETPIFACEVNIQELNAQPFERAHDSQTGLKLWKI